MRAVPMGRGYVVWRVLGIPRMKASGHKPVKNAMYPRIHISAVKHCKDSELAFQSPTTHHEYTPPQQDDQA